MPAFAEILLQGNDARNPTLYGLADSPCQSEDWPVPDAGETKGRSMPGMNYGYPDLAR
jgi:hypothetical protein